MLKSPFRKASSLSATLESTTLPGRSVLLLERLHQHPSCCLSPNWGQQTSQVLWNNPKKNLWVLWNFGSSWRKLKRHRWLKVKVVSYKLDQGGTTGLCAQCHAKSIPLEPSLVSGYISSERWETVSLLQLKGQRPSYEFTWATALVCQRSVL